jgi:mRNA deadenylase 3'-5' endonuclease subunit Ccr4
MEQEKSPVKGDLNVLDLLGSLLIFSLPLVTAGATFILTAGGVYLSRKYRDNKLVQALLLLDNIVVDVVKELNQTVVEDLKKAREDGKLTADEAQQIKNKAIDLVLNRLGAGFVKIIEVAFGPVLSLISTKIEATLFDLKH